MSSVYPYRECECGRQIHVGGVPYCDHCLRMLYRGEQAEKARVEKLALEFDTLRQLARKIEEDAALDHEDDSRSPALQQAIAAVRALVEIIR